MQLDIAVIAHLTAIHVPLATAHHRAAAGGSSIEYTCKNVQPQAQSHGTSEHSMWCHVIAQVTSLPL